MNHNVVIRVEVDRLTGLAEAIKGSHEERHELLHAALRALFGENEWPWIRATFDDSIVYEHRQNGKRRTFKRTYTMDDAGVVTFGEPEEVRVTEDVEPVAETVQIETELIPITEASKGADKQGRKLFKLLKAGWSLNERHYSKEVLERDIPVAFPKGTHMYLNHQTEAEEKARPEGDVRDLAAVFEEDPRWIEKGPDGPGMYVKGKVFSHYRPLVDEIAEHTGLSIRAFGLKRVGEVDGKVGDIIERITGGKSVDFVTKPGADGKVLELVESLRTPPQNPPAPATDPKEIQVDEAQLKEAIAAQVAEAVTPLNEKVAALEAENKAKDQTIAIFVEAGRTKTAREKALKMIAESGLRSLPETAKDRIATEVAANPPLTEAGVIDDTKLAESVKASATSMTALLEAAGWQRPGTVVGMGGDTDPFAAPAEIKTENLVEGFTGLFGLSENGAKIAVAGRLN